MRAAVAALRQLRPEKVLVAVPVAARATCADLQEDADEVVCLYTPMDFFAVGQWYHDFSQTTDEEVRELLDRAAAEQKESLAWRSPAEPGGEVPGGLNTRQGDERRSDVFGKPGDVDIPREGWKSFLEAFSSQHRGWLATVETAGAIGRVVAAEGRRLHEIHLDSTDGNERAFIDVGTTPEERVTQTVNRPVRMTFRKTAEGAHRGLDIESADGSVTRIKFRESNVLPEMLDGVVAA
jgi:Family of unknown function (DUF5335)